MKEKFECFRLCVGAMLVNREGLIFLGRRTEVKQLSQGWQMPQGGVGDGEELQVALLRELNEEIGTNRVSILDCYDKWLFYNFPKKMMPVLAVIVTIKTTLDKNKNGSCAVLKARIPT